MTGVACPVLGSMPPDIVRGGHFPRGKFVKICQSVLNVSLEKVPVHRDMTDRDKLFGPPIGLQGIQADLEVNVSLLDFKELGTRLVFGNMTAIAVLVRHGMTNMTAHPIFVYLMLFGILGFSVIDIFVTVYALGAVFHLIPAAVILAVSVHLVSGVAPVAFEILLSVDIRRDALVLAEVFPLDTASVAGGAY